MDNFDGPLSVRITRFKYNHIMRPMTPYLNWEKLGEWRGVTREENGLPLSCPRTDYRRLVNMYKFHILKSFNL